MLHSLAIASVLAFQSGTSLATARTDAWSIPPRFGGVKKQHVCSFFPIGRANARYSLFEIDRPKPAESEQILIAQRLKPSIEEMWRAPVRKLPYGAKKGSLMKPGNGWASFISPDDVELPKARELVSSPATVAFYQRGGMGDLAFGVGLSGKRTEGRKVENDFDTYPARGQLLPISLAERWLMTGGAELPPLAKKLGRQRPRTIDLAYKVATAARLGEMGGSAMFIFPLGRGDVMFRYGNDILQCFSAGSASARMLWSQSLKGWKPLRSARPGTLQRQIELEIPARVADPARAALLNRDPLVIYQISGMIEVMFYGVEGPEGDIELGRMDLPGGDNYPWPIPLAELWLLRRS